jgi:hypothetical protein
MQSFSESCLCGRSFSQLFALSNHQRTCQKSKKRLSSAIEKAKEAWLSRKKPRCDTSVHPPPEASARNGQNAPDNITPDDESPAQVSVDHPLSFMEKFTKSTSGYSGG